MTLLQSIGLKYGTDKSDGNHSWNGRSYLDVYHEYLESRRLIVKTVLEIGVLRGESIRMWRDYFPNAQIWGLDIDPDCQKDNGDRTQVVIGSQSDIEALKQVAPGRTFDLVIDDGSHVVGHITGTFCYLWNRVSSGGFYAIEDTSLAYDDLTDSVRDWPGQKLNDPATDYKNNRLHLDSLILGMIRQMDGKTNLVQSIHFHSNLIVIQKI